MWMRITKVYNNNCVLSEENGQELVLVGPGIAFQKKIGDEVDPKKINKKFSIVPDRLEEFELLLNKIPIQYFQYVKEVIDQAEKEFDTSFHDGLLFLLTDHLFSAVERYYDGLKLPNLFADDIAFFYPDEYRFATWAYQFLSWKLAVDLPKDEVAYIAMHFVNANNKGNRETTQKILHVVYTLRKMTEKKLQIEWNERYISHRRFRTHLKYLAQKVITKESLPHTQEDEISWFLKQRLKKYDPLLEEMNDYLQKYYDYELQEDDILFLSIHFYQLEKSQFYME